MRPIILAQGVLPLTQDAADAALDAIDFIAAEMQRANRAQLDEMPQHASRGRPSADEASARAINELNRRADMAANLQNFSTWMTANTINRMRSM